MCPRRRQSWLFGRAIEVMIVLFRSVGREMPRFTGQMADAIEQGRCRRAGDDLYAHARTFGQLGWRLEYDGAVLYAAFKGHCFDLRESDVGLLYAFSPINNSAIT